MRRAIAESGRNNLFHRVHIEKPPIYYNRKYAIICRGPISRVVSAFSWRYKLVVRDGVRRNRFPGEWEVLTKYKTINALAESLYVNGDFQESAGSDIRKIHHLREDINFYLGDLLSCIDPSQI